MRGTEPVETNIWPKQQKGVDVTQKKDITIDEKKQPIAAKMDKLSHGRAEQVEREMLHGMLRAGCDCQKGLVYSVGYFMSMGSYETPDNPMSGLVSMLSRAGMDLDEIGRHLASWDMMAIRNWIWANTRCTVLSDKLRRVFDAHSFDRTGYAAMRTDFRKIGEEYLVEIGKENTKQEESDV